MKKIKMHIRGVIRKSSHNVIASPDLSGRGNLYCPHRDCFGWLSQPRNDKMGCHCEHLKGVRQSPCLMPKQGCSATFQGRAILPLHEAKATHYVFGFRFVSFVFDI